MRMAGKYTQAVLAREPVTDCIFPEVGAGKWMGLVDYVLHK